MAHLNMSNVIHDARIISVYRPPGSTAHANVKGYLIQRLEVLGFVCKGQVFTVGGREYCNIIAMNTRGGDGGYRGDDLVITLGAHYDSPLLLGIDASIDAAVSCAVILEMVRLIVAVKPDARVMVVFFDGEESQVDGGIWKEDHALLGSKYFVNNFDTKKIRHFYLLDLWGGNVGSDKTSICRFLSDSDEMLELYRINKELFPKEVMYIPVKLPPRITDDHVPLQEKGVDVTALIAWPFPWQWHKVAHDNIENVDWHRVYVAASVLVRRLIVVS